MRRFALFFVVLALVGAAAGPVSAASGGKFDRGGQFVVQMAALPVVAYDGSIKGFAATKPAPGTKIDPLSAKVTKYVDYLDTTHSAAIKRAGGGTKLYDYVYSYNGFLAKLTAAQANKLAADARVASVQRNERVEADTSSTYSFLGLDAAGGLWSQLGGPTGNKNTITGAGDGMIIGVVDSGIWPESLSFSDRDADGKLIYQQLPGWHGKCVPGEDFTATDCNQKLIGAQFFNASWGGSKALEADRPWEFMSPRDYNGHGTHTSSTSGGNFGVPTTGPSTFFGSSISGMAPRARIAMYKALWSTQSGDTASGFTGDLVAAIDQAVADGVDVINYSISGTTNNFLDPAQVSFLFAAQAGVFVSASAGNSGPATGTVAHPGPWLTTVAAGTHNRNGSATVTLGDSTQYTGASAAANSVGPAPLIDATAAGLSGADADRVRLCYSDDDNGGTPVLDPALVTGKIVVCDRGVTARVNKSAAVLEAGGVGMILVNTSANSMNADLHFVPTVHLSHLDRPAIKAYAATVGATATLSAATISFTDPAPLTAAFSSRGPLAGAGGDLLKPDVIAPGQDILAAVSPTPPNHGLDFNLYSGTSMSAPHVAGLAALLMQAHPNWSPMAIKSALMTSAYDVLDGANTDPLVIFRQGAGHARPNSATDPGLVYDAGFNDWRAFLKSQGLCNFCFGSTPAAVIDPSDYNSASIAIGDLAGIQTVTRTVKNVGSSSATYNVSTTGLTGINVVVTPGSLTLAPGASGTFSVAFTRTTATLGSYVGGQLTWTQTGPNPHVVRIPMVIRPVAIAAPSLRTVTAGADNGSNTWNVKVGYNGTLSANAYGAAADAVLAGEVVVQDPDQDPESDPFDNTKGVNYYDFALNNATDQYWAGGTMGATTEAGSDLDVYLLRELRNGVAGFQFPADLVAQSADGDSEEIVQLVHPTTGNYRLMVHGWGTPDGASTYSLHRWLVNGASDGGSLAAHAGSGDPFAVSIGDTVPITLDWTGLTSAGTQYRGIVDYIDNTATRIGSTVVLLNR
jgi:subtilisin family serine protease